ncbi:PIG-L deacetylase family protein [Sphingobium chlorophenolicum]|uniref:LmbE family protein n=1 Tax=Sphingobium chlorophenolicum TaxID=46429 RepID=A0A081RFZ9_SPHCR|nr:PIG-L deacetylase family protein [Sphingobium chlorophenolicum]KEQ54122.1 LmbE family protein [Sphingobium chlorophenolicum]
MTPPFNARRIAVVAPHPDDEILGCGGTMARAAAAGAQVHVIVVTRGQPPLFEEALVRQIRAETLRAHAMIGVTDTQFLDFPAAGLDRIPRSELNHALSSALARIEPDLLLIPFIGDIHLDHQIVFNAALVHARPRSGNGPGCVMAYETLSETNWLAPGVTPAFIPNIFVDIEETLDRKIAAFRLFQTQVKPSPDERSLEAIRALATLRGATVHRHAAEAFVLVRQIH